MNSSLTDFQKTCADGLAALIQANGGRLIEIRTSGVMENYIEVDFTLTNASPVTAWIYEDECMLTASDGSYHFEKPDFNSQEQMQASFLGLVASLFESKDSYSGSDRWIGLFRGRKL